jgi:hypothetical protein
MILQQHRSFDQFSVMNKLFFPSLMKSNSPHFSLHNLKSSLDNIPFELSIIIGTEKYLVQLAIQEFCHGIFAIQHSFIHINIDDLCATTCSFAMLSAFVFFLN